MTEEYHVYGPPGCGKTTYASRQIAKAAEAHGNDRVLVSSFTKAAATEIAGRDIDIPKHMVGTLHAICYRLLERPPLAELKVKEWNENFPDLALTTPDNLIEDGGDMLSATHEGDMLFRQYNLLRAKMRSRELWPVNVVSFATYWEAWKRQNQYVDFTDLLEITLSNWNALPTFPAVGFIDEAQDLSALQYALVRKWGAHMEQLILLGDDDQAIYDFNGADAENMIGAEIPSDHKRYLRKSYRLPSVVHEFAGKWIDGCFRREPKAFEPFREGGSIDYCNYGNWQSPDALVDIAQQRSEAGERVMILASCGYMLQHVISELRSRGLPFYNPYRKTNGAWNPISRAPGSIGNRISMFLMGATEFCPRWTAHQFKMWTDLLAAKGLLKHGAKKQIAELAELHPAEVLEYEDWREFFAEGDPWGMDPATPDWLMENATETNRKRMSYVLKIIRDRGFDAYDSPKIVVGTIHSVKGGEADTVIMFPDLSRRGYLQWGGEANQRDAIRRLFYVGMTRTKSDLVLAAPASPMAVSL